MLCITGNLLLAPINTGLDWSHDQMKGLKIKTKVNYPRHITDDKIFLLFTNQVQSYQGEH